MLGPNRIERELGRGAMGVVYEATDTRDGQKVALKVLPPELARGTRQKRFEREFELMKRLEHPSIGRVVDAGADEKAAWYSMELLAGPTLGDRIRSGAPVEEIVSHVIDLARALDLAHREGVVHRDVKPENVLLGADGRARLVDFGIARDLDAQERLTRTNALVGTPLFMAPEQLLGRQVDGRADTYALAAILYATIAGRPFRTGNSVDEVIKTAKVLPPPPSEVSEDDVPSLYDAAILRALAPDREARYATAGELADALEAAAAGQRSPRRLLLAGAGLLVLLGGVGGAAFAVSMTRRGPGPTSPPVPATPVEKSAFARAFTKAEEMAAKGDPGALEAARTARQLAETGSLDAVRAGALVGELLEVRGDHQAALPLLKEAEQLKDGRALVSLARTELALHSPQDAKVHARAAAAVAGEDGELLGDVGAVLLDLEVFEDAKKVLERATAARPRDSRAHINLGFCRFQLRDLAHAEDSFRAALDLEPMATPARNGLGAVLVESQRFEEAATVLSALVRDEPGLAPAWSNLARAYRRLKKIDEAAVAIEKARALEPDEPEYACEAGRIALDQIQLGAAEKAFADAVRLDEKNLEASISLAAVLARQERRDEARDVLERIARIHPSDPKVKKALDELRR